MASTNIDSEVCTDEPTLDELCRAVKKLKNGRAAGCDNIPPELLKCASSDIGQALHALRYSNASGVVDGCRPNGRMESLSLYMRAKDHRMNAVATDLSLSSLYQARFSATFS